MSDNDAKSPLDADADAASSASEESDSGTDGLKVTESDGPVEVSEPKGEEIRVVESGELEILETEQEVQMRKKTEEAPPKPKSNFGMLLILFGVLFVMIDPKLRTLAGTAMGFVLNPIITFDGRYPVLTIIMAGTIMITLSTLVRHFFIDWIKMARIQNTMRAFQKEFNVARRERDTKRINELQKTQKDLMGLQAEMSGSQMKPMAYTMLVVIPMFAWLWEFVASLDYSAFSTPWNLRVDMFTTNGVLFGSSVLPHWILLYSVLSIPFGQLLQKALKVWSWRNRVDHILSDHPDVHEPDA